MNTPEKHFAVVNGIAYGEESKGNTVQALVRKLQAHTVWRSGGWQGGHHIVHDDGREIALSHFGAGVFEGADTYLKHMVISPVELFMEAAQLEELGLVHPLKNITIDENCLTTTPFHSGISRTREVLRGVDKKGTIGKGVGEAIKDSIDPELTIRAGEFSDRATVLRKLENIRLAQLKKAEGLIASYPGTPPEEVYQEMEVLYDAELVELVADAFGHIANLVTIAGDDHLDSLLKRDGAIVNEVSHGVLHHPRSGFLPHVTQIDPSAQDVLATLKQQEYDGNLIRLGVVRSYLTRHGAGPFMSYDPELAKSLIETHNNTANEWLGEFKVGYFDTVALQYALSIAGGKETFDGLLLSYMDVLSKRKNWQAVESYEYKGKADDLEKFFELDNNRIIGIKVHKDQGDQGHIEHQLRLTELLKQCEPIVTTVSPTEGQNLEDAFIGYVKDRLGVPIVATAYGPKVTDRYFLPQWDAVAHRSQ